MHRWLLIPAALALACPLTIAAPPEPAPAAQAASPAAPAELARPTDLITVQRGTLPIIISAPHGGQCRVPGSTDRTKGVTVRDDMTSEVALLVAQRLTARLGAKPSFVIAQFSRKDADPNRDATSGEAHENDAAKAQYDAYHRALRTLVDEAAKAPRGAILIDLHGQKREPDAIVRGTRDGKTVAKLLKLHGMDALTGPDSICGRLRAAGYTVLPTEPDDKAKTDPADRHPLDEAFFDGGYIVAHYGSDRPGGIDAIQLELGRMRSTETLKLSRTIADAIAAFYERYLAPEPPADKKRTTVPAAEITPVPTQ